MAIIHRNGSDAHTSLRRLTALPRNRWWQSLLLAGAVAALVAPVGAWAQTAAGGGQPKQDMASNGVPVIDIVAPNAAGVSHNLYTSFNVDPRGLILNNSAQVVRSQLGGYIAGNDNLRNGTASLILNEVTSALPSYLNGYLEVAGRSAAVVIANPYGITCGGCGAINAPRFTLSTGKPEFGADGSLQALRVAGGTVTIGVGGLDATGADQADILAQAVAINGALWARGLTVATGNNRVGYAALDVQPTASAVVTVPQGVALDVAALGGMYAERIRLVGTQAGMGVVNDGTIAAQAGDLELSSAGQISLRGTTVAMDTLRLDAAGRIDVSGTAGTQQGDVVVNGGADMALDGRLIAAGGLRANLAGNYAQSGYLSVGGDAAVSALGDLSNQGIFFSGGGFALAAGGTLRNDGTVYTLGAGMASAGAGLYAGAASVTHAAGNLALSAASIDNAGLLDAGQALSIASSGDLRSTGDMQGGIALSLHTAGTMFNLGQAVSGGRMDLHAAGANNNGVLSAAGTLTLDASGRVDNVGTMYAGDRFTVRAGAMDQATQGQVYGAQGAVVSVTGSLANAGTLVAGGDLAIDAGSVDSSGQLGSQQGSVDLRSAGDVRLAGITSAAAGLSLQAGDRLSQQGLLAASAIDASAHDIDNAGAIYSRSDIGLWTAGGLANGGSLYGEGNVSLSGAWLANAGVAHAGGDFSLDGGTLVSTGTLDAGNRLSLFSGAGLLLAGQARAGGDLRLTAAGALENHAQALAGRDLTVATGSLANGGMLAAQATLGLGTGTLRNDGALYGGQRVDVHSLDLGQSATGSLVGGNGLTVDASSIASRGQLGTLAGDVTLTTHQGDLTLDGTTIAAGALQLASAGALWTDGSLSAVGLQAQAAQGMNLGGTLYSSQGASLVAAGALTLTGTLHAAGDAALQAGDALSMAGSGTVRSDGRMSLAGATLDLAGIADAGSDLSLSGTNGVNLGGTAQAARDLDLGTASAWQLGGQVLAGRTLTVAAGSLASTGRLHAGGDANFVLAGALANDGSVSSTGALQLRADSLSQSATASLGSGSSAALFVIGTLSNGGSLVAGNGLTVAAGQLSSTGELGTTTGDVNIATTAGDLSLAGTTVSAGALSAQSAGALSQVGTLRASTLQLTATQALNLNGVQQSDGDAALKAGTTLALGGTLNVAGNATLTATQGVNLAAPAVAHAGVDLMLNSATVDSAGTLDAGQNLSVTSAGELSLGGIAQAARDVTLTASGTLTHTAQTVAGHDLTLTAAVLSNPGTLSAAGRLQATTTQNLDSQGVLYGGQQLALASGGELSLGGSAQSAGDASLQASGALTNAAQVVANGRLSLQAGRIDNQASGALSGMQQLEIGAQGGLSNAGALYGGQAMHFGGQDFSQVAGASVGSGGLLAFDLSGTLANAGSLVGGNGLTITAGWLSSTGELGTTAGDVNIATTAGDLSLAGTTVSAGALSAQSAGALSQVGTLRASTLQLTATQALNLAGVQQSDGDAALKAGTTLSLGGTLNVAGNATLTATQGVNLAAPAVAHAGADLTLISAAVDSAGTLDAGQNLSVTSAGEFSLGGIAQAARDVTLTASGTLAHTAQTVAGHDLTLSAAALSNPGALASGGAMKLAVAGRLANDGQLLAGTTLGVAADALSQGAQAQTSAGQGATLRIQGALDNAGSLVAGQGLDIQAGGLGSTGQLGTTAGDVSLVATVGDLTLDGTVVSAGVLQAHASSQLTQAGSLQAYSLDLKAGQSVNLAGTLVSAGNATVHAGGDLALDGTLSADGTLSLDSGVALSVGHAGIAHAGGDLLLQGASLQSEGTLDAGRDLLASADSLSLAGRAQAARDAQLTAQGLLSNAAAVVVQGRLGLHVGQLANAAAGSLAAAGDVQLQVRQDARNDGALYAGDALTLTAASLAQGVQAQASSSLGTQLTLTGALDNAGSLVGGQGLTVRAGSLSSSGQLGTVAGDVALTTTAGDLALGGITAAAGALAAHSAGKLVQTGALSATGLTLASTGDMQLAGDTVDLAVGANPTTLKSGGALNQVGTLASAGSLSIEIAGKLDSQGGIGAQQALTIAAGGDLTGSAASALQAGGNLAIDAHSVSTQGTLIGGGTLAVRADGNVGLGALTQAATSLDITAGGSLANGGRLLSGGAMHLGAVALDNQAGAAVSADDTLDVMLSQAFANQGSVYAARVLTLQAGSLSQGGAAQLYGAGDASFSLTGGASSAGSLIAAGRLSLSAASIASTGTLGTQQGDATLAATQGNLDLGGNVSVGGNLLATATGVLTQSGALGAEDATLRSGGNLGIGGRIDGRSLALQAGQALSQSGMVSGQAVTLAAAAIDNSGSTLSQGDLSLRAGSIRADGVLAAGLRSDGTLGGNGKLSAIATGALTAHGILLAGDALDVEGATLDLSRGTQRAGGDATLLARSGDLDHTAADLAAGGRLVAQTVGTLINAASGGQAARMQAGQLALTAAAFANQGGQLLQTGTTDLALQAAGLFDNTGGTVASNGSNLTLHAARLVNDGGSVQLAGTGLLDIASAQDLDNRGGTLVGNGAVHVAAGSGIANGNGLINARQDMTLAAASLANTGGAVSGNQTSVILAGGALDNRGGLLQATAGGVTLSAASLANAGGIVQAVAGALDIGITGLLDNSASGLLGASANAQVHVGQLDNAGGTLSAGSLGLTVDGAADNRGGRVQSAGALDLRVSQALANNGGSIEGNGAFNLVAASLSNRGGRIANAGTAATQVTLAGTLDSTGGTLGGQGDVTIAAASIGNTQGGRLVAGNNLALGTGSLDNRSGTVYAGNTLSLLNAGASVANAGGSLGAGQTLKLTLGSLDNVGGTLQAGIDGVVGVGSIDLNVGSLTGQGNIFANLTLGMHVAGDYVLGAGSSYKANGGFNLAVDGQFTNDGSLQAVTDLSISAANITNGAGALLNANRTLLNTAGSLSNAGSIQGDSVGIHAGSVDNTGTIMGGDVTVQAGSLVNGADLGTQTGNAAYQSGTVAATRSVDLYVGSLLNRDAQIYSLGDIHIAGAGRNAQGLFDTRSGMVGNLSGSIQAQGDILIAADQIDNHRRVLETTSYMLTQAEWQASQPLPSTNYVHRMNKAVEWETWTEYHTLSQDAVDAASAQSQIVAGGSIALFGSITNNTSIIAAAGKLGVNQVGFGGTAGMITGSETVLNQSLAGGRTIQPVAVYHHIGCGWDPSLCDPTTGDIEYTNYTPDTDPTHYVHDNVDVLPAVMSGNQGVAIGGFTVSNGGVTAGGQSVTQVRLDPNAQRIGLGAAGHGGAGNVAGGVVGGQVDPGTGRATQVLGGVGRPLAGVSLPTGGIYRVRGGSGAQSGNVSIGNAGGTVTTAAAGQATVVNVASASTPVSGGGAQAAGTGTVATGVDAATADGTLPGLPGGGQFVQVGGAPTGGTLQAASAGQAVPVSAPGAGTLTVNAAGAAARTVGGAGGEAYLTALLGHAPSRNYLIETNSRFADYSQFVSSDYLLERLGYDPQVVQMRLGDGFYEQQLVVQQVTQLTGRAYLSDYSSGLAEYQALLEHGVAVAQVLGLSVGVALTPDQVSALTQDMVWLVQQTVDGHEVLVPVVYLAANHLELSEQGAVIAGRDVSIQASGTLSNDGSIAGTNSAVLTAQQLLNTGRIQSQGVTALSAAGDILNTNGLVQGGTVSLVAGGDIRSTSLAGLANASLPSAGIQATQGLQMIAGHDLSLERTAVSAGGSALLSAGHDLNLAAATTTTIPFGQYGRRTQTQVQGQTLTIGQNLTLSAGHDLSARAVTLKAGGDLALVAGNDLSLSTLTTGTRWNTQVAVSTVTAGGSLSLAAGHDLTAPAVALTAGGNLTALAGHDLSLAAVATGSASQLSHQVATLNAGGNLVLGAGNDLNLEATQLKAGQAAALSAGHDLNLTTITDQSTHTASWKEGKKHVTQTVTDQTLRGVTLDAGTGVALSAGHDANLTVASVSTQAGPLVLQAGHDVNLLAGHETHTVDTTTQTKKHGLFSSKTTTTHDVVSDTAAIGTTLSGDIVTVAAGHNLSAAAAQIAGTGDVTLAAGHDLTLTTADSTHSEEHQRSVKKSGLFGGGGFSVMLGSAKQSQGATVTAVTPTGTLVGSTDGSVALSAGKDVHITGSNVLSQTGTTIVGSNVTVDAALGTTDGTQTYKQSSGGITLGLSGGVVSAAQAVYGAVQSQQHEQDSRVSALRGMQAAAYLALHGSEIAGSAKDVASGGTGGINLQIGIGGSSASSKTVVHDETAIGSHIQSRGNVTIAATGGDLNVVGSDIMGGNVTLLATRDMNLRSQQENHSLRQDGHNASGGVGFQVGTDGMGFYAQAAVGKDKTRGNGATHAESRIGAVDTLSLVVGNDALLQGAQLRGNSVVASVGHDLTLRSEQDTDDYASKQMQASGKVVFGMGGSASYSQGKTDTHYRSVTEQTGIDAGSGGFQISVGNHTQLDGAVIGSSADPSRNVLSTGSLGYSDIKNESKYSGSSAGASLSYSAATSGPGKFGGTVMPPPDSGGSKNDETKSAIAAGTLAVADGSGLDISRDTAGTNGGVTAYDARAIEKNQAFASELVGTALSVADDYYTTRAAGLTKQMVEAERNARDAEMSGDAEASQRYWREAAALREQRDDPSVNMAEVRGAVGLLASAVAGKPSLGYALESSVIGYGGEAWYKAGVGHNETMALKITCANQNANQCANDIQIPKDLSPDQRVEYAREHGLDIQYISEIPQGAKVIATNGILNDEARAAQVAIGHAAGDEGTYNNGNTQNMTIYLQFNDTKGGLSDLMQAGYDKFVAPWGSDYSATTYAMAHAAASQGGARFEMDGHSWGSITTRNALYVLADNDYQNGKLVVKVFGPAVSPEDMAKASQAVIGKDVIKSGSLFYYSNPNDPVAAFVGGTLFYSPYLDPTKPDQHIPGAAQADAWGALKGGKAVFSGAINPHSCYALNCRGVPGGDTYNWTVQRAEQKNEEGNKP